jgi:peptidoglycan/LPS O-acetylase OafA/YrhL
VGNSKLDIVQILRFAAASEVVFVHANDRVAIAFSDYYSNSVIFHLLNNSMKLGVHGVDLFFIISGFIMVWVTAGQFAQKGAPLRFFRHRLIRIVPPYWVYTTLALAILIAAPQLWTFIHDFTWPWVVSSYLFIPAQSPLGSITPLIDLGWTLNYEMYFYIVFAIALFLPGRLALVGITAFFVICPVIGGLYTITSPLLLQATNWILLEFIFGVWIGYLFSRGIWLSKPAALISLAAGVALLIATAGLHVTFKLPFGVGLERLLLLGVPLAMCFAALVSLFRELPDNTLVKIAVKAGDASYSIYLFSFFALPGFAYIFRFVGLSRFIPVDVFVPLLAVCSIVASYIVYRLMEKPVTDYLRRRMG